MNEYRYSKNELMDNKISLSESEEKRKEKEFERLNSAIQMRSASQSPQTFTKFEHQGTVSKFFGAQEVTAESMNNFISQLQQVLLDLKRELNKNKITFGVVYDTFKFLDTEYIRGILASQRSANIANGKAKNAIEGLQKAQARLDKHQNEISEMIENNNKMLNVLVKHQEDLNKIKYLKDVDKFVNYVDGLLKSMDETKERINEISNEMSTIESTCRESIDFLNDKICTTEDSYQSMIETINEKIKKDENNTYDQIKNINQKIDDYNSEYNEFKTNFIKNKISTQSEITNLQTESIKMNSELERLNKDYLSYKEFVQEKENNLSNEFENRINVLIQKNNSRYDEFHKALKDTNDSYFKLQDLLDNERNERIENYDNYLQKYNEDFKEIHKIISVNIQNQIDNSNNRIDELNQKYDNMSKSLKKIQIIAIGSVILNIILIVIFIGIL